MRLLLVEDDPLYQRLLTETVLDLGYDPVGPAATASLALRLCDSQLPDLVLCDIHLAGEPDGIGLAQELRTRYPQLPLIFVTSLADAPTFSRARAVGPAAYLTKPFDEATLQRAIELALYNASHAREAQPGEQELPEALVFGQGQLLADACFVRDRGRLVKVPLAEVRWIEATDRHCDLHRASGSKVTLRLSLRELARQLDGEQFVQVHRSFLINAQHLEALDPASDSLTLKGGAQLPLGRAYRDALLARLRLLG